MSGIRTLFVLAMLLWASATALAQQNTIYVRANGNDANNGATEATANLTIAGALADAQAGDVIDIGAGDFAGATVGYNVTLRGANAGMAIANWGAATNITSTVTLGAPALEVYVEGVSFGAIAPMGGASADALVTLSMCRFTESNALTTAGLDWYELTVVGCAFDGNADNVGPNAASAITASGLDVFFVTESSFDDYAGPGVEVTGSQATVKVTYNNFTNCNTGGATSTGAVALNVSSFTGATRVNKNLFTTCSNGVTTSGALSGKDVTVQYNRFVGTPNGSFAIRNNGTGLLSASCNNYGTDAGNYVQGGGGANDIFVVVGSLLSGSIEAGPFNQIGTDTGGDLPGFEPDGDQQCGVAGPITTTSTSKSYFRVQDAIDASAAGATVTLFGNSTFTGNVTVAKDITVRGADTASVTGKTVWSTINGSVVVTLAAESVKLVGLKITSPTATTLVTNGATTRTQLNRCWLMVDPSTVVASVPSFGALHHTRSGELYVWGSRITRPVSVGQEAAQYMRAVSLASSSASRLVYLEDNTLEGTIQITGMSMYAAVTVKNNTITDAGVDGLSITGNFVRTLSVTGNSILNSRENGIGIRGPATVGSASATITGNKISGSGQSGSAFAAINIASTSYGTQTWNDNHIADQFGSNKIFINGRTGYSPVATCNWWGVTSEDDLLTKITGTVAYDNGVNGWRGAGGNSASVGYVASGAGSACTIRSFTITLAPTDVTCFGGSNGSIVTTLAGTQSSPTYSWTKANSAYTANTKDISNLTTGTYTVSINNGTGNVRTKSASIAEPTQLSGTPSKTNITCNGANNGSITVANAAGAVSASNPTPTYQYRLDKVGTEIGDRPAQSSNSFADLTPGNYDVYIIANGVVPTCERMIGTMAINEPSQLNASVAKVNISCFGLTNGSITLSNVTGGTHGELPSQTYTYRIDRQGGSIGDVAAQSSPTFSNLIAGTYDVYVIADGVSPTCERIVSTQVIFEPTLVMATVAKNNISCNGSVNGSIDVTSPLGGTHPDAESRSYSYMIAKTNGGVTGPQGSGSFTNLGAGEYVVSVITASAGSTTPACTTVVSTQNIYEPSVVASTTSKKNISCNNAADGEISFTAATGGTHTDAATRTYNYRAVNAGNSYDVTNNTGSFTGLSSGTYTLSVIALADGPNPACTTSVTSQTVNLPTAVSATTAKTDISCATATDGEIRVTGAIGGTHADAASRTYQYMIAKQDGGVTGPQSSGTFSGLGAGTYTISVIAEAIGTTTPACTTTVAPQTIYVPTAITASVAKSNISCNGSVDGTITVSNPQGGTHAGAQLRNYQYAIVKVGGQVPIGPQVSGSFTGLGAGEYNVFVIALQTGTAPACSTLVSTQTINEPTPVTATTAKNNITCINANDGTISITGATGGIHADAETRTYNYRAVQSGGGYDVTNNTGSFTSLGEGTYTLSVIALATGSSPACTTSVTSQTIHNPSVVTATTAKTNITCDNANDGTISITGAAGGIHTDAGTRTYNYRAVNAGNSYDVTNNTGSFTGLSAGTYTLSVIALATGSSPACTTSVTSQTIHNPSEVTATTAKTNITCNNANDGTISITGAAGG
ncbi:MAG: beta strand repeat-containing protein, partial [Ignavibacteria bacterium]